MENRKFFSGFSQFYLASWVISIKKYPYLENRLESLLQ